MRRKGVGSLAWIPYSSLIDTLCYNATNDYSNQKLVSKQREINHTSFFTSRAAAWSSGTKVNGVEGGK